MRKLHEGLRSTYGWYDSWHQKKIHSHAHWASMLLFALLTTSGLLTAIGGFSPEVVQAAPVIKNVAIILVAGPDTSNSQWPINKYGTLDQAKAAFCGQPNSFSEYVKADSYGAETWNCTFYYNHSTNDYYRVSSCQYTDMNAVLAPAVADGYNPANYSKVLWTMPCDVDLETVAGKFWRVDNFGHLFFMWIKANGLTGAGIVECIENGQRVTISADVNCHAGLNPADHIPFGGDPFGLLSQVGLHNNAYAKELMGWLPASQVQHIWSTQTVTLCPVESQDPTCTKMVYLDTAAPVGGVYQKRVYIEYRQRDSWEAGVAGPIEGIHLRDRYGALYDGTPVGTPATISWRDASLQAGQVVTDNINGLRITVLNLFANAAQVRVEYLGAAQTPPIVSLRSVPPSITSGFSANMVWSSSGATSCTASGSWSGSKPVSSSEFVTPSSSTNYLLTCTGPNGTTVASTQVTVDGVVPPPPPPPPTQTPSPSNKFVAGDTIQTNTSVNVRSISSVSGTLMGTQANGNTGGIVTGGAYVDGYYWWYVNYDTGADGWSVEDYLVKYTPPPPPPPAPPASNKFTLGQTVYTNASVNVRQSPTTSSSISSTQAINTQGSVIGVPTSADGYVWWQINYSTGQYGWTVEDYLGASPPTIPTPPPTPTFTPSANCTKATSITMSNGDVWTLSSGTSGRTLKNGTSVVAGSGTIYKLADGNLYVLGGGSWYKLIVASSYWSFYGTEPACTSSTPAPTPPPTTTTITPPPPTTTTTTQTPTYTPSANCTKATSITMANGDVWTFSNASGGSTLQNGVSVVSGAGNMYKLVDGNLYVLGGGSWYKLIVASSYWSFYGAEPACTSSTITPPPPTTTTITPPPTTTITPPTTTVTPSANCTKATSITMANGDVWTFSGGTSGATLKNGIFAVAGNGNMYKLVDANLYVLGGGSWYKLIVASSYWSFYGSEPACGGTTTTTTTPTPPPASPSTGSTCAWSNSFTASGHLWEGRPQNNVVVVYRDNVATGVYGTKLGYGADGGYDGGIWLIDGSGNSRKSFGPEGWPVMTLPSCLMSTLGAVVFLWSYVPMSTLLSIVGVTLLLGFLLYPYISKTLRK